MNKLLTAAEASALLGVSPATLYSYVSRGILISSSADEKNGERGKRYRRDEVLRLAARRKDGRQAGHVAEQAIDWGMPILESHITLIDNGVIRYRGRDAMKMAVSATLEDVAALLWDEDAVVFGAAADADASALSTSIAPDVWQAMRLPFSDFLPLDRATALLAASLPSLTTADSPVDKRQLMQLLAAALLNTQIDTALLHKQCCRAWQLDEATEPIVRAALVACADHELNVSTFTVRCVTSAGAPLPAALIAGLAALAGTRHGGESLRVRSLIDAALNSGDVSACLAQRQATGDANGFSDGLPGFGHPLYPDAGGDPRARMLMELLRVYTRGLAKLTPLLAIAEVATALTGQAANIDFALAAIEYVLELPRAASQTLFALGRSAGWIAHALEQEKSGRLIRPRARYVGAFDFPD